MPSQLPFVATPVGVPELAAALSVAWRDELGAEPSRSSLLVLLAQWSLETGGGAACIQWNLGNAKSLAGDGYDWTEFPTTEVVNGAVVHITARFRAFASLTAGAADYLKLLTHRFAKAWPFVAAGDVEGFARALHEAHYYTAPVEDYARGMLARASAIARAWPAEVHVAGAAVIVAADDQPVFAAPSPEEDG